MIPVVFDGGLIADSFETNSEVLITKEEKKELGLDDIDRLIDEVEKEEEDGNYQQAIDILEKILVIEQKELGPEHQDVAYTFNWLGDLYFIEELFLDAESSYWSAFKIQEKNLDPNDKDFLTTIDNLVNLLVDQNKYKEAENLAQKLLNGYESFLEAMNVELAEKINTLAYIYLKNNEYEKAKPLYIREIKILKYNLGEEHQRLSNPLNNLGYMYAEEKLFRKAESVLYEAIKIRENTYGTDHKKLLSPLNNLTYLYENEGDVLKANNIAQRLTKLKRKLYGANSNEYVFSLNELGNSYNDIFKYQQALETYKKALGIIKESNNEEEIATLLYNISNTFLKLGLFSESEEYSLRALSIAENLNLTYLISVCLNDLATAYWEQGLYEKAEPLFLKSLSIIESKLEEKSDDISTAYNNLGLLYSDMESYKRAELFFKKGLTIDPENEAILGNLALNYKYQGLLSKANSALTRSLEIARMTLDPSHPGLANTMAHLGNLNIVMADYKKAEEYLQASLQIYKKSLGTHHPSLMQVFLNLYRLYFAQGLTEKTIFYAQRSIDNEVHFIRTEAPYLIQSDRLSFIKNNFGVNQMLYSFALKNKDMVLLSLIYRLNRHGLLEEIEKNQSSLANSSDSISNIVNKIKILIQKLSNMNLEKEKYQEIRIRKETLEKQLYRLLPELKARSITKDQVTNLMPANTTLIEYVYFQAFNESKPGHDKWTNYRYLALVLNQNGEIEAVDLGLAKPIEDKIQQALTASEEALVDAQQLWKEVGDLVIKPLKEAIGDAKTLFISPDAELNRIPFAALSSHKEDQLLGDAVNIRLLTTGRELLDLAKESKSTKRKPLVIANPAFNLIKDFPRKQQSDLIAFNTSQQRSGDLASFNWSLLPGTAKEGKAITKITKAQLLTKNKATALAVQEQQEAPKVLHIASHAYFLPDQEQRENPLLRSGIVLAGANEPESNPKDDGYLTALEVTKLDWNGTELVVISGCESGKGDIQSGEGVYGLKRAIAVAGARSSLLSLWKVDDRATAAFMTSFYKKLKAGEGRADALASTQKEFRNHPIPAWRHPYVWAAFQLSGDWRPIQW